MVAKSFEMLSCSGLLVVLFFVFFLFLGYYSFSPGCICSGDMAEILSVRHKATLHVCSATAALCLEKSFMCTGAVKWLHGKENEVGIKKGKPSC